MLFNATIITPESTCSRDYEIGCTTSEQMTIDLCLVLARFSSGLTGFPTLRDVAVRISAVQNGCQSQFDLVYGSFARCHQNSI